MKAQNFVLAVLAFAAFALLAFVPLLAHSASIEVKVWQGGAKAAHTIAHDDYCGWGTTGIEDTAIPILNARGLKASLGLIAGNCKDAQWATLKERVKQGHELFNHTLTHVGMLEAGTLAPIGGWDNVKEVVNAQQLVQSKLGYTMHFIAFPSDLVTPEAKAFVEAQPDILGARAAKDIYDGSNAGLNDPEWFKPMFVKWDGYWRDGKWSLYKPKDGNILIQHVDAALQYGAWSYRTMHGVADASWESVPVDQYTAYADYLAAKVKSGELWVAGPTDIIRYIVTREHCKLKLEGNVIKLVQSNDLCKRYASAVTVDVELANGQKGLFSQNSTPLAAQKLENGHYRINMNPAVGDVTIR
ncbi:polysaccharide deacetylase family protein [Chitinibacter bivalviorum]|uniref:Polysaccharide deacetylase family protein n=1 Tax=Chitinibacter bivalviorum TaxID=2739434 RepID=A0A7H9BMP7_9NEIS|nr:polysaccharide deacetylase family protein [Chitinibacter bivalviorum]QLG88644.1 polysaccharide deacetylase family protein [Chitinibacter bivalviorum]